MIFVEEMGLRLVGEMFRLLNVFVVVNDISVVELVVRMSLIRLNDNRAARLQLYPSGYIATGVACSAAKLRYSLIAIEYFLK
jgi:NADH:ubiquinone oxidoreductase subunit 3 (subunit A)